MNSNNNVSPEFLIVVGVCTLLLFVIKVVVIIALSVGILLAAYMTGVALIAWNDPVEVDGEIITPAEARTFICGGIVGGVGLLAVAAVSSGLGLDLSPYAIKYAPLVGYIVGSFGAVHEMEQDAAKECDQAEHMDVPQTLLPPPPPRAVEHRSFTFAEWNDGQELP